MAAEAPKTAVETTIVDSTRSAYAHRTYSPSSSLLPPSKTIAVDAAAKPPPEAAVAGLDVRQRVRNAVQQVRRRFA